MAKKPGTKHRTTEQQLADAEERLARLRKKQRDEDTRRRVLVGSLYLGRSERSSAARQQLLRDLDSWLTDERDRRIFDLGAIPGLYSSPLHPSQALNQPGWAFSKTLRQIDLDRYGNPIPS